MSDADKPVRLLIDDEWSSLITKAAMQIQTMKQPVNRLVNSIGRFAESEEGKNLLEGMRKIMEAQQRAETLSDAIHNADDIGQIQKVVDSIEIDAVTLMSLIVLERSKEASQVELNAAEAEKNAHIERSANGGNARVLNDKDGKQARKQQAFRIYTEFNYKRPSEFAKAVDDKHPNTYSYPVLERWYRHWKNGINLPKNI